MRVRYRIGVVSAIVSVFAGCGDKMATGPSLPTSIVRVSGDGQSGTVGLALPSSLVVKVTDSKGSGVPGVAVSWSVVTGSGSLDGGRRDVSAATDASGLASVLWHLGPHTGLNTVTAAVSGTNAIRPVAFTATGVAGSPSGLAFSVQPTPVVTGGIISPAVQIMVQDAYGNAVPTADSEITLAITGGTGTAGATLGGTRTVAAVSGVATFSTLTVDKAGTGFTLTATATGLTSATSSPFPVTPTIESTLCSGGTPTVLLLVEDQLRAPVSAGVTQYATDLCADGYRVWLANSVPPTPPEIRAYLADALARSGNSLAGVMLIGDIPRAYQFVVLHSANPNIPDTREEVISFQYYADLNGQFSASPGYYGTHPYSYDLHDGDVDWEVWVGVLPVYKGSTAATIAALTRYFDKNHAYRTGGSKPPRAFLEIDEFASTSTPAEYAAHLAAMQSGTYSWTPFSNSASAQLYFNSADPVLTIQQGYSALRAGDADFTVVGAHGFYGASGQLTIALVETNPVQTIFFWSSGCAIGDLDHADNFLTSVVYSPTSAVLVGKGTTNNSGGMGSNQHGFYGHNIATALAAGASFGAAIVGHVNTPLVFPWSNDREFHFGTPVIVGDPTLRLRQ